MLGTPHVLLSAADHLRLAEVANDVSAEESRQFRRLLSSVVADARAVAGHWDFGSPARVLDRLVEDSRAFPQGTHPRHRARLRQAAVARLALGFFEPNDRLPDSILKLYPSFFGRLAAFLHDRISGSYDDNFFAKDVRYALGLTIPCGALQFDLNATVGPKLIARDLAATNSFRSVASYLTSGGWGRWYGNHLDIRALKEFTPAGWTASFARIAETLERNPAVRGVAGVGWFYDPQLARISPHLAYISQTPLRNGAFLIRMKTAPHDIENALVRSPWRKKLYQQGEYHPACYLLAWPRRELLGWAKRLACDASAAFGGSRAESRHSGAVSHRIPAATVS
jgi:hypothetical protein